jgi:hypothetical protein
MTHWINKHSGHNKLIMGHTTNLRIEKQLQSFQAAIPISLAFNSKRWFSDFPTNPLSLAINHGTFVRCRQTRELFRKSRYCRVENCKNWSVKTQLKSEIRYQTSISDLKVGRLPMRTAVVSLSTQIYTRRSTIHNIWRQCFIRTSCLHTSFLKMRHSFLQYISMHSNVGSNGIRDPPSASISMLNRACEFQIIKSLEVIKA